MLCLSCKVGERIFVGDVPVKVVSAREGKITLGVDAESHIPVDREKIRIAKTETINSERIA